MNGTRSGRPSDHSLLVKPSSAFSVLDDRFDTLRFKTPMDTAKAVFFVLFLPSLFLTTGCSSSMPWVSSTDNVRAVTGTYEVQQFEFTPKASNLKPINVLEYMEEKGVQLELTQSRDFVLSYHPQNRENVTVTGTYSVTSNKVELNGQRQDVERYQHILLNRSFYLLRKNSRALWVETEETVAPENLSSSYDGLSGVEGLLHLELRRE